MGPLEDSCLKAIARWQVISTVAAISGLLFRSHAPTITLKAMLHLPPAGNSCTTVPIACMHMLGARHVQRPPQLQLGTAARHLQVVLSPGIMRMNRNAHGAGHVCDYYACMGVLSVMMVNVLLSAGD